MMAAIGAGFSTAGFFHLLTHGLFKALLFLGAGAVIHAVGSNDLSRMGGLARRMPQTATVFIIGTLSLAGIPLFAGFLSKEEILGSVWEGGLIAPFALLMLVAFLTAFYMFRVVFLAFFGTGPARAGHYEEAGHYDSHGHEVVASGFSQTHDKQAVVSGFSRTHDAPRHAHHGDPPAPMLLPLWTLALLSMAVGLYSTFIGPGLVAAPEAAEHAAPGWLTPAAVAVALAGIALAWLTYQRGVISAASLASAFAPIRQAALQKFWIDDLFEGVVAGGTLAFSRLVGWIDRYIVDGVLNVVSVWTVSTGDEMRTIQTGRAQDYIYGLAVGLLLLLVWARWSLM
jgi:NADH:ubiquinone oxidoreductase subunit 5 (subunit L)/multisubunit Na+/H+ antiporter MnhA subunit